MWDAISGGNEIQSITLQPVSFPGTGSAPTNRITSVTSGQTSNYSYDANGNTTNDGIHSYTYDSENRVMTVDNGAAVYAYDHQNRRYKKTVGTSVTHYLWEGNQVVGEYNGSTGAMLVQYSYAGRRMIAKTANGTTQYFLSDRLSPRLVLSDVGVVAGRQSHLPFGEDFGESGSQEKHHFTSYERDAESALDYSVNRSNSPNLGRFQQADPYKASGDWRNPKSLNRYSYTENDPLDFTDPQGLLLAAPTLDPSGCYLITIGGVVVPMGGCDGGDPTIFDGGSGQGTEPSSCTVSPSLGGPLLAHYRKTPREPNFNPNATPLGPIVTTWNSFPFWGYYFELVINPVNLPFLGWTYHESLIFSTSITYKLPDGTEVTEWPQGGTFAGFTPNDPIRIENTTGLVSDTDQFHTWLDAPGISLPDYHPLYKNHPIVSIHRFYDFLFEAKNGTTSCSSALHLELTLNLSGGSASAAWSH